MNASTLKIIGIVAMVLDHIGWVLFPDIEWFHIIGKLAIPIFCYMIAEGYYKTHNVKRYFLRLLAVACISQVPFSMMFRLCFGEGAIALNTIFNLVLGLLVIWIYDKVKFIGKGIIVIIGALVGLLVGIDGDFYVVVLIFICYKYHNDFKKMAIWMLVLTVFDSCLVPAYGIFYMLIHGQSIMWVIEYITMPEYIEAFGAYALGLFYLLALIPIKFYNGKKGNNIKLLFYSFYPVHFLVLYLIGMLVR